MTTINQIPLLDILTERLSYSNYLDQIIIATTGAPIDDQIVAFSKQKGILFLEVVKKMRWT